MLPQAQFHKHSKSDTSDILKVSKHYKASQNNLFRIKKQNSSFHKHLHVKLQTVIKSFLPFLKTLQPLQKQIQLLWKACSHWNMGYRGVAIWFFEDWRMLNLLMLIFHIFKLSIEITSVRLQKGALLVFHWMYLRPELNK